MDVTCENCGVKLKARDDLAGKKAKCPKCGNFIEIVESKPAVPKPNIPESKPAVPKPNIPLATERQKEYAESLGVEFSPDINRKEISKLIEAAAERHDTQRYQRLDDLSDRESEAWKQMREEVLEELDQEDCRLSKATPSQMLDELENRDLGAILISFNFNDVDDFKNMVGVRFNILASENMKESEMRSVVLATGYHMLPKESQQ